MANIISIIAPVILKKGGPDKWQIFFPMSSRSFSRLSRFFRLSGAEKTRQTRCRGQHVNRESERKEARTNG